jgi:hypothetical protein
MDRDLQSGGHLAAHRMPIERPECAERLQPAPAPALR